MRPMRPKPLMPTLMAMTLVILLVTKLIFTGRHGVLRR